MGYISEEGASSFLNKKINGTNRRHKERKTAPSKVYNTAKWRRLSKYFRKKHPFCVECGHLAEQVDHIHPLNDGGAAFDEKNLQSLCRSCHSKKTYKESLGK